MRYCLLLFVFLPYLSSALDFKLLPENLSSDEINEARWDIARGIARYMSQTLSSYPTSLDERNVKMGDFSTMINAMNLYKDNIYSVFEANVNRSGPTVKKINNFIGWWRSYHHYNEQLWIKRCEEIGINVLVPETKVNDNYTIMAHSYYNCKLNGRIYLD